MTKRVLVLGATGGTGREVVARALAAGWEVTGLARRPPADERPGLRWVAGDVRDAAALGPAVEGQDAVVWTVGARPRERGATDVCEVGTRQLIAAMRAAGVRRVVVEGAYGAGDSQDGGPYARWLRGLIEARLRDKERQEELLRASGLDWTILRPTLLTNGPRTGEYVVAEHLRVGWLPRVSRADVADLILRELETGAHVRRTVAVTGA